MIVHAQESIQTILRLGFSGLLGYSEIHTNTKKTCKTRGRVAHTYLNQPWFQVGVNNDVISACRIMMMSYSVTYVVGSA